MSECMPSRIVLIEGTVVVQSILSVFVKWQGNKHWDQHIKKPCWICDYGAANDTTAHGCHNNASRFPACFCWLSEYAIEIFVTLKRTLEMLISSLNTQRLNLRRPQIVKIRLYQIYSFTHKLWLLVRHGYTSLTNFKMCVFDTVFVWAFLCLSYISVEFCHRLCFSTG